MPAESGGGGTGYPLTSVPVLNSLSGATAALYLDFDGDTTTSWNGYSPGTTPAFDTDGDATSFSDNELAQIRQIWARVAEKYAPFKINVTTVDPGNLTNKKTMKIVIGGNGSWLGFAAGGISSVGSFVSIAPNISFVFPANLAMAPAYIGEAAAHEAGHGFGLEHQSVWSGGSMTDEYNPGDSLRAPIMGLSYYSQRGLWWQGLDPYGNTQNDLGILSSTTNAFGYRADDRGNTPETAAMLSAAGTSLTSSGIINSTTDVDYYSFTTTQSGQVSFNVTPGSYVQAQAGSTAGSMADVKLELRDNSNSLIASADTASLGETLAANVGVGTYYLVVGSHGQYGDLGTYNIAGTLPTLITRNISIPTGVTAAAGQAAPTSINIDNAATLQAFDFTINYNTALLDLANGDVTRGSLLPGDWSITVNVDDTLGQVRVTGYTASPLASGSGELVHLNFHVPTGASAGKSTLSLTGRLNEGQLPMNTASGEIIVPLTVAITGAPASSPEGTPINLGSTVSGSPGPFTYSWNVTKNGSAYTNGSGSSFSFTPSDNATYVVSLTASDGTNSGTDSKTITVTNVSPTVAISDAPGSSPEGTPISLTSMITDPGSADTFTYAWTVTKNGSNYVTGTGASLNFTPDDNATYIATLLVTDKDGGTGTDSKTITVTNVAPSAAVAGAPPSSLEGTAINLTGSATDPGSLDTFTYAWTVTKNDSNYTSGSGSSFSFTPNDNGTYIVTLTATDKDGASGTDSKTITVTNVAPTAVINGAPASSPEGTPISLTSTVTDPGSADTFTYAWSVTKNGANYASGTSSTFNFTPDDNATYIVSLTITDKDGATGSDSRTITVTNAAPTPTIAGAPTSSPEGTPVSLTASATDPGTLDTVFTYAWTVTKNGSNFITGSGASFGFTPDDNGTYVVTVTATDKDGGTGSDAKTITVTNVNPAVTINGAPASSPEGTAITFTSTVTDPGSLDTFTYAWSVTKDGSFFASGTGAAFAFTPNDSGAYAVTLNVTDKDSGTGSASKTINITNVPPAASIAGAPTNSPEGTPIHLTGSATDPSATDTISYQWSVTKDGSPVGTGSGTTFDFTPADNGLYLVTLTATDQHGASGTDSKTITVTNVAPTVAINGTPGSSPEGTPINLTSTITDPGSADTFTYAWTVTKNGSNYTTGAGASLSFTPDDNATYIVTLLVTDKDGGTGTDSKTITVTNVAPSAAVAGAPPSSPEGTAINLTGSATDPGSLDTITYAWTVTKNGSNFTTGSGASFSFTPDDNGTYIVTLTATDKDGASGTDSKTINVTNVAPTAAINGAPASSPEGTPIPLTSTVTDPGSTDTFTYGWTVTKNGANYASGTSSTFNFTPDDNATYVVSLTITDKDAATGSDSKTITVTNAAPTPTIAGAPTSSPEGTPVSLTASATDPGTLDTAFTYAWTVTKNGSNFTTGSGASFGFTPDDNGTYVVTVTATDKDGGSGSDAKTITVTNGNPAVTINGAPASSPEGTAITFTSTVTDPGSLDTFTYAWNVTKNGSPFTTGSGSGFSFTPDLHGTYVVSLTVTDKDSGTAADSKTITVTNLAPTALITGAPGSSPEGAAISLASTVTDPGTADTFTYLWQVSSDNGQVIHDGTAAAFSFIPNAPGSYQVTLTVTDSAGATGSDSGTITSTAVTFQVTSVMPTSSGVDIGFNRGLNLALLNLYNTGDPALDPADLTLVGSSVGAVKGSLVWDSTTNTARFIRTGGVLPADTYTLTLASRASGWVDTRGGMLDGNADGTAGDNYTTTFTIAPSPAPLLSIPDFVRVGGQSVNVPDTGSGLPVWIRNAAGASSVSLDLVYNPALLSITAAATGSGVPFDWTITSDLATPGIAHIVLDGSNPLDDSLLQLVRFTAAVPAGASRGSVDLLQLANVSINGGTMPALHDSAIHVVAAFGDTTGNGDYSGLDASYVARISTGLDTGLAAYRLIDPVVIADVTGDGSLSGMDAAYVARIAVGLPQAEIPALPGGGGGGAGSPAGPGTVAATLSVPESVWVQPGGTVSVPVQLTSASGLLSVDLSVNYSIANLDLSAADLTVTGLPQGWSYERMVSDSTGTVRLALYAASPLDVVSAVVANLNFHVPAGAGDAATAVALGGRLNEGLEPAALSSGSVVIDGTAPTVSSATYDCSSGPQKLVVKFSENVLASLSSSTIVLLNQTTGQTIDPSAIQLSLDPLTSTATLTFPGLASGVLPDGNYTLTIPGQGVWDRAGNPLAGGSTGLPGTDYISTFFVLAGDANRDRSVDFIDLVTVSQNYSSTTGGTWVTGDFNGDGAVNFIDLVAVSQRYGTTLPVPSAPVMAVDPVSDGTFAFASAPAAESPLLAATPASKPATAADSSAVPIAEAPSVPNPTPAAATATPSGETSSAPATAVIIAPKPIASAASTPTASPAGIAHLAPPARARKASPFATTTLRRYHTGTRSGPVHAAASPAMKIHKTAHRALPRSGPRHEQSGPAKLATLPALFAVPVFSASPIKAELLE